MHSAPPDLRRTGPIALGRCWLARPSRSGLRPLGPGRAIGLFHDGVADACLVTALFRDFLPAVFRFLAALERTFDLGRAFHELVEVHRAELAADNPEKAALGHSVVSCCPSSVISLEYDHTPGRSIPALAELVHRIVSAARLQGSLAGEIFLVLVADIGAGHVLMLDAGDTLTDLLALNILHIAEHALLAEIVLRKSIRRQSCRVIGRQGDQMVEDTGTLG